MFIPFLGAAIFAKSLGDERARRGARRPRRARSSAASARRPSPSPARSPAATLLLALAYVGFLINLFNLLPVVPLDGGRAMAAMAPWMWFVGFGALVALGCSSSRTRSC